MIRTKWPSTCLEAHGYHPVGDSMFYHASSKKNGACYFQVKFLYHLHKESGWNEQCLKPSPIILVLWMMSCFTKLGREISENTPSPFWTGPVTFRSWNIYPVLRQLANSKMKVLRPGSLSQSVHLSIVIRKCQTTQNFSPHGAPLPFDSSTCSKTGCKFQPKRASLRVYVYYPEESRPLPIQ